MGLFAHELGFALCMFGLFVVKKKSEKLNFSFILK
jgi:hypothetical protein